MSKRNKIASVTVPYSTVATYVAFNQIIDLETTYVKKHLMILSTLDTDVVLQLPAGEDGVQDEITVQANSELTFDDQNLMGALALKYSSAAPTEGAFQVFAW